MAGLRCNHTHHGKVIVPAKPTTRTITWDGYGGHQHLVFPHTLYVMYYTRSPSAKYWLNRLHVCFSLEPFTCGPQDRLYGLPLANMDVGHAVCFYDWPHSDNLKDFANKVIAQYWASPYKDYGDGFSYWLQSYTNRFRSDWNEQTRAKNYDWLWGQTLIQPPYICTLQHLLSANKTLTDETDILLG